MIATVHPSSIQGKIRVPTSKSAMQRALAAALIRRGQTLLFHPGQSEDDLAALRCIRALGASVHTETDHWVIDSKGIIPTGEPLDCGESGLSIRMFTPLAALSDEPMRINGSGSLTRRPMRFFEQVFPQLGVDISMQAGCLPFTLRGPLRPTNISVDGTVSSQFITGLLMAYSAAEAKGVSIEVRDLKSRPYVDLTLQILRDFGLPLPVNEHYQRFHFQEGHRSRGTTPLEYHVEGDWSGASFWFIASALAGTLELTGLDPASLQADRALVGLLRSSGQRIEQVEGSFCPVKGSPLAFEFDATDCPDLFPPLVALASHLNGMSSIHGAGRLQHKESDRARTLQSEFGKLGVTILLEGDTMRVMGEGRLKGGVVSAQGDHRIAMSLAVAALGADGPVHIGEAESVGKSYPGFWRDLQSVGASVSLSD